MQKRKPRNSDKHRPLLNALVAISASVMTSACAITGASDKPGPLIIQEQGSFAVGGTVITSPGTFNPIERGPDGQTFHGDHAYVFYQSSGKRPETSARALAWLRTVLEDLGDHAGWARGLPEHLPAPGLSGFT